MKLLFVLLLSSLLTLATLSQSCLPDGITFTTQSQIDSFAINYPGCTEIEGDLIFSGESIEKLDGLSMLTSVGGSLRFGVHNQLTNEIESCPALYDISGLSNLTSVSTGLVILGTHSLKNLNGLQNLINFGGFLYVVSNDSLTNLDGLQGLTSVADLLCLENKSLLNFHGLENINYIPGNLTIGSDDIYQWPHGNPSLVNLEGFNNLDSVGGYLQIYYNNSLFDLSGLESLVSIGGSLEIFGNRSLNDISSLHDLGNIDSSLIIRVNDSLKTLDGLQNLQVIGGYLYIGNNYSLTSLEGLESLNSATGVVIDDNKVLASLSGLDNLDSIADYLSIINNEGLKNLNGLENLKSVKGKLKISSNAVLSDLLGLINLFPSDIENLLIFQNPLLSVCEAKSICGYLTNLDAIYEIHDNAERCQSREEVLDACSSGIQNNLKETSIFIYPNPASDVLFIESSENIETIGIFNSQGEEVRRRRGEEGRMSVPVDGLVPGLYLVHLETSRESVNRKIIIKH